MKTSLISLQIGLGFTCCALTNGAMPAAMTLPHHVKAALFAEAGHFPIVNDAVVEKKTALDLSRLSMTSFGDVDAPSR